MTSRSFPPPPSNLPDPNLHLLDAGQVLHRLHLSEFSGDAFNPCMGGQTRFAPLHDKTGACVPSLYAATSFQAACYETLFHDVGHAGRFKTVPLNALHARAHSVLTTTRPLRLAALFEPDLKRWELARASFIAAPAVQYAHTVEWAAAVHAQFPDIEGLIWTSNQCDPDLALILFGDRVSADDLEVTLKRSGARNTSFAAEAREAAQRGGITFTL